MIVHEACHARLTVMGLRYEKCRHRHEMLCRKQEQIFLEKAKADDQFPIPATFDSQYSCRYGSFEHWAYEGNGWSYHEYLDNIWSNVDNYVAQVDELRTAIKEDSEGAIAWYTHGSRTQHDPAVFGCNWCIEECDGPANPV